MFDRSEALSDLRHKLEANVPTFGAWQQLNSPAITELLCGSKSFDWIVFDLEHGLIDFSSLYVHILAAELHGKLPFVRLCNPSPAEAHRALEIGCSGIIYPNIKSAVQLRSIVDSSLWPPNGSRGVGFSRSCQFGREFRSHNEFAKSPFISAMIESAEAINDIKSITSIPYVDTFLIGPYDLSASLNVLGDFSSSLMKDALNLFSDSCQSNNVSKGFHVVSPDSSSLKEVIDLGYTFIPIATDALLLDFGIQQLPRL